MPATDWIDALQRFYTDLMLAAAGAPVRYFPALGAGVASGRARPAGPRGRSRALADAPARAGHAPLNAKLSPTPRSSAWCYPAWRSPAPPVARGPHERGAGQGQGRRPQPGFPCTSIPTAI